MDFRSGLAADYLLRKLKKGIFTVSLDVHVGSRFIQTTHVTVCLLDTHIAAQSAADVSVRGWWSAVDLSPFGFAS